MPKAEVGSVKHLNKQMKARGLTRLRWYCQVCERAMRDENAFKQHTLSESHVRNMLSVGADPRKAINEYSNQFLKDFLQLLRTGHGEKQVQINHFYQEYIAKRDHTHMNATRWSSLTELAKHLGREGLCRVEENEKGIFISWIDTSPEALKRQDALRRKEAQDRGDEEWERRMLQAQIDRAERAAAARKKAGGEDDDDDEEKETPQWKEGEKIKLTFGSAKSAEPAAASPASTAPKSESASVPETKASDDQTPAKSATGEDGKEPSSSKLASAEQDNQVASAAAKPVSLKLGGLGKPQHKNVFAAAKKLAKANGEGTKKIEVPKKMSEAERIMKEEMERKRGRGSSGGGARFDFPNKKPRF